jgi:hypothetical protein
VDHFQKQKVKSWFPLRNQFYFKTEKPPPESKSAQEISGKARKHARFTLAAEEKSTFKKSNHSSRPTQKTPVK